MHGFTMNHSTIEQDGIVDRYVTGRLTPDEAAAFENHFVDCPSCIAAVEDARRLHRGLARVVAQEAVVAALGRRPPRPFRRFVPSLVAAALLMLALIPAYRAARRGALLEDELARSRRALDEALAPRLQTALPTLAPFRDGADRAFLLSLPADPEALLFALQPQSEAETYRVVLEADAGTELWRSPATAAQADGTVLVSFVSTTFAADRIYVLRLEDGASGSAAGLYRLRTVAAP